ncbi:MAG: NAD+ synthase [Actinomycetota bacterium]|nr:NAD+ synthase [Actinomycetota bacterium]
MSIIRLYLAQINPTVGDFRGNHELIAFHIEKARSVEADIVVFPELCITGYPPEDLLLRSSFIEENMKYIKRIKKLTSNIIAIIGFVNKSYEGVYNSAAVIYNNQIKYVYNKQFLSNCSFFDEERYFKRGNENFAFKIADILVEINISDDIFHMVNIEIPPANSSGVELLINISASPYHTEKIKERINILSKIAIKNNVNIACLNMVGGQDEMVFDGNSLIINNKGKVLAHAKPFAEDIMIYDFKISRLKSSLSTNKERHDKKEAKLSENHRSLYVIDLKYCPKNKSNIEEYNYQISIKNNSSKIKNQPSCLEEEILGALILGTRDYVRKNKFKEVVIALSGGIDSALTVAIATLALGRDNVNTVMMPSLYTSPESIRDSEDLCRNLSINFITVPIWPIYESYLKSLTSILKDNEIDITKENIQARIRGNIIMAFSNEYNWLVLATGNKSELSVGYCTLYGDMAGGFSPIKDVYKTMVYRISKFINKKYSNLIPENIITKVPSAELKPDQKDEDKLPPYEILDPILKAYLEDNLDYHLIIKKGFEEKIVRNVINMVDSSEYKRRQSSPGIKITPPAPSGKDRRYPITNSYKL